MINNIFKSNYMFRNELSLSMLDLGQISIIDNSVIYYYNYNNTKERDNIKLTEKLEEPENKLLTKTVIIIVLRINFLNIIFYRFNYLKLS